MKELVQYVKERPGQLSFGSTGIGATPHLAVEMFMRASGGLKMTHVPYRGMPQAVNDVVGNHVQMVFADPAGAPPLIKRRQAPPDRGVVAGAHQLAAGRADHGGGGLPGLRGGVVAHDRRPCRHAEADRRPAARRVQAHRDVGRTSRRRPTAWDCSPSISAPPDELKKFLDKEIASWGQLVKDVGIAGTE